MTHIDELPSAGTAGAAASEMAIASGGRLGKKGDLLARRWVWIGVFFLAVAVRVSVAVVIKPYLDETHAMAVGRYDFGSLLTGKAYDVGHPVGYHMLLSAVRQAVGESIAAYRLIGIAIGSISVLLAMKLVAMLIDDGRAALGVGLLMAINPMQVMNSVQIRCYGWHMFFVILAQLFVLLWCERRQGRMLAGYVISTFLAFNFHYLTGLLWGAIGLWWLWISRRSARQMGLVIIVNLATMVLLIPTVVLFSKQFAQFAPNPPAFTRLHMVGWPFYFLAGPCLARPAMGIPLIAAYGAAFALVFVPAVISGVRWIWRTQRQRGFILSMLALPFAFVLAINVFKQLSGSRYLNLTWVAFAAIVVYGIVKLPRWWKWPSMAMLTALSVAGCIAYASFHSDPSRVAITRLLSEKAGDRFLVMCADYNSRMYALEMTQRAKVWSFGREQDGRSMVQRFPIPPDRFVEHGQQQVVAGTWEPVEEAFKKYVDDKEVWLIVDRTEDNPGYRRWWAAADTVKPLLEESYDLVEEYIYPPGASADRAVHMLKYSRR